MELLASSAPSGRLGGGDEWSGEPFVEREQVFHAVAVAGEWLGAVTAVHGAAQVLPWSSGAGIVNGPDTDCR